MPARRVQVVDHKGPERRHEFAQDVAANAAPDEVAAKVKPDENFFAAEA